MENHNIIFSEFEFTHGINKPKIVVFQVNAAKQPYQTLNYQIEQLKIKVLFNLGAEPLKLNTHITIKEQLNPLIQDMKKLAMQINDYLFGRTENVGLISGSQINNSIKLYLTFLHIHGNQNYKQAREYNLLSEEDKNQLQQILYSQKIQPELFLATQSKIRDMEDQEDHELQKQNQQQSDQNYQQPPQQLINNPSQDFEESKIQFDFMPPSIVSEPKQSTQSSQLQKEEREKPLPPSIKFTSLTETKLMCLL